MKMKIGCCGVSIIAACFMVFLCHGITCAQSTSTPSAKQRLVQRLKSRILSIEAELETTKAKRSGLQAELSEIDGTLRKNLSAQDATGISEEAFPEILRTLQTRRIQLIIDLSGIAARQFELKKIRSSQAERAGNRAEAKYKKLIGSLQAEYDRLKTDPQKNKQKLVETEVLMEQAKRALTQHLNEANLNSSSFIAQELIAISLDLAENKARLSKVEELLGKSLAARNSIESINNTKKRQEHLRTQIERVESNIQAKFIEVIAAQHELVIAEQDDY